MHAGSVHSLMSWNIEDGGGERLEDILVRPRLFFKLECSVAQLEFVLMLFDDGLWFCRHSYGIKMLT